MTISRRDILTTGGAALTAGALTFPTLATALEGESGLIIALLAAAAVPSGDNAPKPARLNFSALERKQLSGLKPREQTAVLSKMLTQKLSRAWDMEVTPVDPRALNKALGGKGLQAGEYALLAMNKGPKFQIKITIVIKF